MVNESTSTSTCEYSKLDKAVEIVSSDLLIVVTLLEHGCCCR